MAAGGSTRTPAEQLAWERRLGPYAAAAAGLAALLSLASYIYPAVTIDADPQSRVDLLVQVDRHPSVFLVSAVVVSLATLALGAALAYLYEATRNRRAELPTAALVLTVVGVILAAVIIVVTQLKRIDVAHDFLGSGSRSEDRARELEQEALGGLVIGVGFAANMALGFAIFLISLNAMRAGLLSRFMGVLGIVVAVLRVLPLRGGPQFVELFWLGALAALFLDRWPGGRGRAWEAGEAIPWPTAAEQRAALERRREEVEERGGGDGGAPAQPGRAAAEPAGAEDGGEAASTGVRRGEEPAGESPPRDLDTPRKRAAAAKSRRRRRR